MSSILNSERYTLKQVAKDLNVHIASIWRWVLHGVRGHKLPTILIGGRRYVLRQDLEAFLAAGESRPIHQQQAMEARAEAAGKVLDAYGITGRRTRSNATIL